MTKICKNCNNELPGDSEFCQYCGSNNIGKLEKNTTFKRCIKCGKEVPNDALFCPYCGSKNIASANLDNYSQPKKINFDENKNHNPSFSLFKIIGLVICALLFGIIIYENTGVSFENAQVVIDNYYYEYGDYKFEVVAPSNESVYVYIKASNGKVFTFLVKENCSAYVYLKLDKYKVYYATGKNWHGESMKFGLFTKYYVDNANIDTSLLVEGEMYQTTFEPLDYSIYSISKSEFPS